MVVQSLRSGVEKAEVSDKMKALLEIAGKVRISGKEVTPDLIEQARNVGAGDEEIHDTVLIAAAFCMYNRYVDGLNTNPPENKDDYVDMGKRMANVGYKYPPLFLRKFIIRQMRKKSSTK